MNKELLKVYRQAVGLSQKEMGEELGVTKQMVSQMERGKTKIPAKLVHRFYEVFEVDEAKLAQIINLYSSIKGIKDANAS